MVGVMERVNNWQRAAGPVALADVARLCLLRGCFVSLTVHEPEPGVYLITAWHGASRAKWTHKRSSHDASVEALIQSWFARWHRGMG